MKKFLFKLLVVSVTLFLFSCSESNDTIQNLDTDKLEQYQKDFNIAHSQYIDLRHSYHQDLVKYGNDRNGVTKALIEILGSEENAIQFLSESDALYSKLEGQKPLEAITTLFEEQVISEKQLVFLERVFGDLDLFGKMGLPKEDVLAYVKEKFIIDINNEELELTEDDYTSLRLFGSHLISGISNYDPNAITVLKSCNPFEAIVCAAVATAGGAITFIGSALFLNECRINGQQVNTVYCAAVLGISVWQVIYRWCCANDGDVPSPPGCSTSPDPCCGVQCASGYDCVNGDCVLNGQGCLSTGCPPGYRCRNNRCVPR